jgi:hypothetical protein
LITCEEKLYKCDPILRIAVEDMFSDERDRVTAWKTVGIIRELYSKHNDRPLFTVGNEEE